MNKCYISANRLVILRISIRRSVNISIVCTVVSNFLAVTPLNIVFAFLKKIGSVEHSRTMTTSRFEFRQS